MIRSVKDTRRQWLGSIPQEWELLPLGRLFEERREATTAIDAVPLSVTKNGVVDQLEDVAVSLDGAPKKLAREGDIVINSRSDRKGSSGLSPRDGSVSVINTVLYPVGIHPRYAHHLIRSTAFQEEFYRFGSGIVADLWTTRWTAMKSITMPVPPLEEQKLIADYLDRETAEIDAFIEDHERLLQLLDERVTTTIEATILGVDAATTVDTGQEWPATLPFGWTAQRVSWLFDATGSGTTPTSDDVDAFDGDIPWVTTGELREKAISTSEKKVSSETLRRYSALKVHPTGSLLIAMYGATIGRVGWLEVPATVNQAVCVLSGYKAGPLRFPYYALLAARPYLLTLASGGGQPNINQDKIRSLRLPVPPPAEQERIVAELDHTLEAEYAMRRDVERSLELARERKTALISAAVTGQIDVAAQDVPAAEQLRDELEAHL